MITYNKTNTVCGQILDAKNNTKELYKIVNKLTEGKDTNPLPPNVTDQELAEDFATYFLEKIQNIRSKFADERIYNPPIKFSLI